MRRLVVFTLATTAITGTVLGVTIGPAAAHICPVAAQIPVGVTSTISVGVTVEDATVTDVEITVPTGLRLDRVDAKPGWTFTRRGPTVRYRGGTISPFTCEYFSLGVSAPDAGAFGLSVVQRTADGTVVARAVPDLNNSADRVLDQFVYAGVKPPSTPSGSSGLSSATIAGIALVGVGVVMFGVLFVRSRRARRLDDDDETGDDAPAGEDDREAELQARLDRFKKRAPGPPPAG